MKVGSSVDLAVNFAFAFGIFLLWGICGLIMFFKRHRVSRRYWLAWAAAFFGGMLQFWTLLHAIFPVLAQGSPFVTGLLRGAALALLVAFMVVVRNDDGDNDDARRS